MFGENPPAWLRWANTSGARATTTLIAIVALMTSVVLLARLQGYINCVADSQRQDSQRTAAIAVATDAERAADNALIEGPLPGGPDAQQLRANSYAARQVTDRVRAQNPPPALNPC